MSKVVLKCAASDLDQGTLSYTWSKLEGDREVTFTPNNSKDASSCTATFSAPGTYVLRVTVVDRSILDPATWNWSCSGVWHDFQTCNHPIGSVQADVTVKVAPPRQP